MTLSMRKSSWYTTAAVLIVVGTHSVVALAAGGNEEIYIRKGVELRRKGQDKEALVQFFKAYESAHTPRAAAQLGLCEQTLEQWLPAHLHLSDALAAESDVWVSQHRDILSKSLEVVAKHLGRVDIVGKPDGALVVVAGNVVGRLPEAFEVQVLPGSVTVTATADGFSRFEQIRQVKAGEVVKFKIALERSAVSVAPPAAAEVGPEKTTVADDIGTKAVATEGPASSEGTKPAKIAAWSAIGGGAVLVGAGVVFGLRSSSQAEEARTSTTYDVAKADAAHSSRTISLVCLGAGSVALAVGAFLYLRTGESSQVALAPSNSADGASVLWKGTW